MLQVTIERALVSVTHKDGLVDFSRFLANHKVELVSTGGTKKMLKDALIPVTSVSEVTGFPEILGGRVKTLHPHVHGGVLADKDNPEHLETLAEFKIKPFDLVCVNLYDFALAAAKKLDLKQAVEQIDIGGPTLLRAAAKNFHSVLVVCDPADYPRVQKELEDNHMNVGLNLRREMAAKTFAMVSRYDALIASYLQHTTH
jgi:phosphoribosylaminoimidazolecarboxamide formyltransferase/IMP cyclohydrolase